MTQAVQARGAGRSEGEWRGLLSRHAASGLSVEAFCRREGISKASFYRWRSLLDGWGKQDVPAGRRSTGGFIDAGSLGSVPAGAPKLDLKLDLGGGLVLHLVRG